MVRDWSNHEYGFNDALISPRVNYGDMDDFLQVLPPGVFMGGVDFQDCLLHWLVSRERRRLLGVRHPVAGRLGVYLVAGLEGLLRRGGTGNLPDRDPYMEGHRFCGRFEAGKWRGRS